MIEEKTQREPARSNAWGEYIRARHVKYYRIKVGGCTFFTDIFARKWAGEEWKIWKNKDTLHELARQLERDCKNGTLDPKNLNKATVYYGRCGRPVMSKNDGSPQEIYT